MGGLFTLLSLSVVMAMASFLPGLLPLFSLRPSQSRLIISLGSGVLVGTSLVVIIPEGVDTLYSATLAGNSQVVRAVGRNTPQHDFYQSRALERRNAGTHVARFISERIMYDSTSVPAPKATLADIAGLRESEGEVEDLGNREPTHRGEQHHHESPHAWIGVALISGFVLMFIIEKLPQHARSSKPAAQPYHISLNDLGQGLSQARSPSPDYTEANRYFPGSPLHAGQSRSYATTTGLVIHAAADGIALGASSSSPDNSLSFIVFFAIMVHKAPTAFGLTSVLLKQGLSRKTARAHLLLFSLAAPCGAILTFLFARTLGLGAVDDSQHSRWWTGMLLLFSAGTFLYVAVHTMQDVGSSYESQPSGHVDRVAASRDTIGEPLATSSKDLIFAIIGMILPLFLQLGHAH